MTILTIFLQQTGSGLQSIVDFLNTMSTQTKTAVQIIADIVMYLSFGATVILILTNFFANQQGRELGFSAGSWAIRAAIVAAAIFVAKQIFGV